MDIYFGSNCDNCNKELRKFDPQFFCYFCNLYYCETCGNLIDNSKEGSFKYIHPHSLIWINITKEEGLKNIDEYRFGKKLVFEKDNKNFKAICNGCKKPINDYRFLCMKCRPGPLRSSGFIEICYKCLKIYNEKNENNEQYNKIKNMLEESGHDREEHIYLRIAVSSGNYYRF